MVPLFEAPLNVQEDARHRSKEGKERNNSCPIYFKSALPGGNLYARNWEWTSISRFLVYFVLAPSQRGNHKNGRGGGERVTGHIAEEIKDK